jgi:hypothetical protein
MAKLTVKDMADMINDYCDEFRYLEAYRLVKETINLWKSEEHKNYLCATAKIAVEQVLEG